MSKHQADIPRDMEEKPPEGFTAERAQDKRSQANMEVFAERRQKHDGQNLIRQHRMPPLQGDH